MEDAYDRLEGQDPKADALERRFEEAERRERLQREFDALKSRLKPEE